MPARTIPCPLAALGRALLVGAVALTALVAVATPADAQQTCEIGVLVGEFCRVEGDPPAPRNVCPDDVLGQPGACYVLEPFLPNGTCPVGTVGVPDANPTECRRPIADVVIPMGCEPPFMLDGTQCIVLVAPSCTPPTCAGRITLSYSVECVGAGRARVVYGQPQLENGARVSLITLNGSPNIGAEVAGGSPISVAVTPVRPTDQVTVNGPTTAPACAATTPTATPQPAATTAPSGSAHPAATTAPTSTPTTAPQATTPPASPTSTATPDADEAPADEAPVEPTSTPTPTCPEDEVLVDGGCLPPCSSGRTPCFDVSTTGDPAAAEPTIADDSNDDDGGAPVVTLAVIGGATVVLSTAAYAALSKRT